jgi:hypothetical protein
LAPVDVKLTDEADLRRMVRVDDIVADLQQAKNLRILVLDACRDNPLAEELKRSIGTTRALPLQRGLAKIDSPQGMIIGYATQAGRTADDGTGRNSPYSAAFLRHIEEQEEIGTVFRRISADVYRATNQTQLPELSLSLIGEFYLRGKLEITVAPSIVPTPAPSDPRLDACAGAQAHWKSAEAIGTIAAFQDHITRFPNCAFVGLARASIEALKSKVPGNGPPVQWKKEGQEDPSAPVSPVAPKRELGYSDWLTHAAYQQFFEKMVARRQYPRVVEAQIFSNTLMFRAAFSPYPNEKFSFYSHHGMSADDFARRNARYGMLGYTLTQQQSVKKDGDEFVQGVWIRR